MRRAAKIDEHVHSNENRTARHGAAVAKRTPGERVPAGAGARTVRGLAKARLCLRRRRARSRAPSLGRAADRRRPRGATATALDVPRIGSLCAFVYVQ